jgi:hypothetical protein
MKDIDKYLEQNNLEFNNNIQINNRTDSYENDSNIGGMLI